MRMVRLKDQQLGRAEVLTSYGKALEKDGGGERTVNCLKPHGQLHSQPAVVANVREWGLSLS